MPADAIEDKNGWKQKLTINLRMKASEAFKSVPLTEKELELEEEEIEELKKQKKFSWHCRFGLRLKIRMLETEFNEFRGLLRSSFFDLCNCSLDLHPPVTLRKLLNLMPREHPALSIQ